MLLLWKRFFLILPGAFLLINNIWAALAYEGEKSGFYYFVTICFAVLGAWMIRRGWRLRPPSH